MEGRLIETRVSKDETKVDLNVSGWSDGLYLIRVTNHSTSETYRIVNYVLKIKMTLFLG
ncbi:MAG: T9SS type A sorting domain-containing protein [Bacteroidetes bacterium]|nr:T9SS type A sorting domain-containing protein [Bacteroidota bacterium]